MGALDGVRVVDFSWYLAGPMVTEYIAAHGGTVVTIESRKRMALRTASPFKDGIPGENTSGAFAYYNPNKYSMLLDFRHPRAMEVVRKLVAWADVVAENFSPGTMEGLGLGYEQLRKIKPDIIMLCTSNLGEPGPWSRLRGFGYNLTAFSGFAHFTGWPDREPAFVLPYTDLIAPRLGAIALIAALEYRRKTGKGQLLDISQLEAGSHFLAPFILDYSVNGRRGERSGNTCSYAAPHGVYQCQGEDRWCAIAVFTDSEWGALCQVIGHPEWTADSRFSTLDNRKENGLLLDELIGEFTASFGAEEVEAMMQAADIPAGVVKTGEDLCQDPQLNERHNFWRMEHKEIGHFRHMGQLFNLSKTPAEPRMPAPCLGEHTEYVCKELLGTADEEFVELLVDGVFE